MRTVPPVILFMFRKALIAVLLLATVCGPQWCCCRLRQWLAESVPAGSLSKQAGLPICCTHGGSGKGRDRIPGNPTPCPCKQRSRDVVQSTTSFGVMQDLLESTARVLDWLSGEIAATSNGFGEFDLQAIAAETKDFCSLGGRDLLRVYGVLRC